MRNHVEEFRHVRIDDLCVPLDQRPVNCLDRINGTALGPIAVGAVFHVRLKDRLQHQLCSGLNHPVFDRRQSQGSLPAVGLGDHHSAHRLGPVALAFQLLLQPAQPVFQTLRFNLLERHPIHARGATVGP